MLSSLLSRVATVVAVKQALKVIDDAIKDYADLIDTAKRAGLSDYEGTAIWRYQTTINLLKAARRTILWKAKQLGVNPRDLKEVDG